MNRDRDLDPGYLQAELQAIATISHTLAKESQGNCLALLALLRTLEGLHREIREGFFLGSLPDNRQTLYALLKDIEEEGGWPYIDRLKLREILVKFPDTAETCSHGDTENEKQVEG